MTDKQGYIAVFDSGVGGISVLKRLMAQMPQEKYLYYGDSANAPYGDRPEEEILQMHQEIYRAQFTPERYARFIQIPLAPGEKPFEITDWTED